MRTQKLSFRLSLLVALSIANSLFAQVVSYTEIALNDPNLYVQGAKFSKIDETGLHFLRFDESILESTNTIAKVNPVRAKTTSGVMVSLLTASPTVRLHFSYVEGDENRNSHFGTYQNGAFTGEIYVPKANAEYLMELASQSEPGEVVRHDVVLPSWANPILSKIEIEQGEALESGDVIPQKTVVFLGDSISHGTGQGSASYKNYPFIASQKLGVQGYNLAVGGGKISPPVADLLQHFEHVDAIWVLVGYNNWQGANEDIATITSGYEELLATIRIHHPDTKIFCSTLTYERAQVDAQSGVTVMEVRSAVSSVVNERFGNGDYNVHLVLAETFTDDSYLRTTTDPVHFSEAGAAMFADDVYDILSPHLVTRELAGTWMWVLNRN